jgi:hypothetical protein
LYLCCTTGFSRNFEAADSNYAQYMVGSHRYAAGSVLPAGTKVTVVDVGYRGVSFRPEGSETTYAITFSYGKNHLSTPQYFSNILRETNPMTAVSNDPSLVAAIDQGRLMQGMTREQALLARGYPPAHRTPDLSSNEWIYYESPGFIDRVVFVDGKIQSITRADAE